MILYFFERVADDDFIGPIVVAADKEDEAWALLARREGAPVATLKDLGWQIAQELGALPRRSGVVYPSHYRRAIIE
jgi:hypothetical protein